MRNIYIFIILLNTYLNSTDGCNISSSIFNDKPKKFKIREDIAIDIISKDIETKITEKLTSINVGDKNKNIEIKRVVKNIKHICPPFCIQPINIDGVKTVGELEVLDFIKGLNGKEPRLFIDIRKNREYKKSAIPGSINIPFNMLKSESKYQTEVLTTLGGKKIKNRWMFEFVPYLLIFGQGSDDSQTVNAIKILIELSYPKEKIYYYRAGFDGWKKLGLTIY